ncbi:hypothetical protein TruAng_001201 [Truncatella angustata]|nr:hypothetical protein TruAng_001201 [Truncatella angustata]
MALVDYSDSESDAETVAQPTAKPVPTPTSSATAKKPIQKVVDRSNPRKIVVSLGASSAQDASKPDASSDEPPAKKARTGGGAFGGFASLLPPPKNRALPPAKSSSTGGNGNAGKAPPRVGINLKTGAAPGFSRDTEFDDAEDGEANNKQPSIPDGQKPADEVKLVGKPLMFKPLSVSRNPKKKTTKAAGAIPKAAATAESPVPDVHQALAEPPPKKKVSLFSISAEADDDVLDASAPSTGAYEPMFSEESTHATDDFAAYDAQYSSTYAEPTSSTLVGTAPSNSLDSIASDMNLDAAARRELFGRSGVPSATQSATRVINFNTDQEYAHNEELRASGEQQVYNPVRAIAPGKHSLQQLVRQVHNQKDALEESFAKSKTNQKEAGQRYGWR